MTDKEVLLLRRKLDLLLRTGKLLMESAADTNRIERNMKRVAAFMGIPEEKLHIDIRWTMIMVNVSDERNSFSKFQKCEKHGINMTTISQVSKLSWRAIEQDYSLDKYEEELEKIVRQPRNYTPYIVAIGAGFACGGFCKLFGGDWIAFLLTSICTFIGFRVRARCVEAGLNAYMGIALAAFICTCLAYASSFLGISGTPYLPLLACALFIVPGVPLINFVDDMIDNHLLVGITRAANTVMMVAAMTFGIAFALRLLVMNDVSIDHKFSELSMVPHDPYYVYAIAAGCHIRRWFLYDIQYPTPFIMGGCFRRYYRRMHPELRELRAGLWSRDRLVYGKFRCQPDRSESGSLVPCTEPCIDDPFCYPNDPGSIDVSLVIRFYQPSRGDRRGYERLLQWY